MITRMTMPRTDSPSSPESDAAHAWRVILVGRTGLDQALRRDAGFELVRARDSIDALGELSDPIDDASPARAAVVVAPDAEPESEERTHFLAALRRVDPEVRVIRVGELRPGYDAAVSRDADAAVFRAALNASRPSAPAPDDAADHEDAYDPHAEAIAEPPRPADQHAGPPADDPHEHAIRGGPAAPVRTDAPADDAELVRSLLAGRSILGPALALARTRAGRDDLTYDSATGRLSCPDHAWSAEHAAELGALNAWLSAWVKLDAQHRELRHAAFTDPLTGAWNRRYFDRFMDAAIEQAKRARRSLTLMVFDIDDFKKYNDAYGHAAGDEILIETVRLLNSNIRPSDRVCRVGGDEFAVIFYEPQGPRQPDSAPPETVYQIATRFQQQVCNHRFPKLAHEAAGSLTISGGLASFPWDGHDAATLLDRADQLSLSSKKQGKNALTFGRAADKVCRLSE
ncbi:MAG: diguanylate cyclase [Phycisphaerales bacterium]|nr:diguanylate cyclase [Planctomycetota bacterium]MCH8509857.1 diguanylate cyclase [Phycisphaerales bacterium]